MTAERLAEIRDFAAKPITPPFDKVALLSDFGVLVGWLRDLLAEIDRLVAQQDRLLKTASEIAADCDEVARKAATSEAEARTWRVVAAKLRVLDRIAATERTPDDGPQASKGEEMGDDTR